MEALWALLTVLAFAFAIVLVVRTFDRALRRVRSLPRSTPYRTPPPSPAATAARHAREQVEASRRTLRRDIAEMEQRHEKGGVAD